MERKTFNKIYAKYFKKDYFSDKQYIKKRLLDAKELNIKVCYKEVKNYLKNNKQKVWIMILKRIEERKQGKHFPLREKFTHSIFKELSI